MIHTEAIVTAMLSLWDYNKDIITKVAEHFKSLDETYSYIEMMDGEETKEPADIWEMFCNAYGIEHEIDNNPFL